MPTSAKRHLIAKVRQKLDDVEIRLHRRKSLPHPYGATKGAIAIAHFEDEGAIDIAVRGHKNADELVLSTIHELLHLVGYNEEAVDEALDRILYSSPSLRAAVAIKLLEKALGL